MNAVRAERLVLVSHLAHPREVTGAERSLLSLARGFRERGREVSWWAPGTGESVDQARAAGLPVEVTKWPRLWLTAYDAGAVASVLRAVRFASGAPRLLPLTARLRGAGASVALVNTLANLGAAYAARRAGLPVVVRVAEIPGPGLRRALLRALLTRVADRVVTVSQAVADALGIAHARVVHSGVALPSATQVERCRRELRAALDLGDDALVVGHVGQLRPHKGQRELVEAAARAAPRLPAATFAVLGDTERLPGYADRLRSAGRPLGDRLRFPGFVDGGPAGLDVLAFTSTAPDPFPRVILEAMAAAVPVVAFTGGGVAEAVVDEVTGRLVATGDVAGLAEALVAVAVDADRRRALGRAGRARAREQFLEGEVAGRYLDVVDEVAR